MRGHICIYYYAQRIQAWNLSCPNSCLCPSATLQHVWRIFPSVPPINASPKGWPLNISNALPFGCHGASGVCTEAKVAGGCGEEIEDVRLKENSLLTKVPEKAQGDEIQDIPT